MKPIQSAALAITLIIAICIFSCKSQFNSEDRLELRLDGISFSIDKKTATLSLSPNLQISQNGDSVQLYKENADEFLDSYFWVISAPQNKSFQGDTLRGYNATATGYGSRFIKFSIVDIYGDALSDTLTVSMDNCIFLDKLCEN